MINRQAMRGAGTKTTTKAPVRTKLTKEAGARTNVKTKGKANGKANGKARAGSARPPDGSPSRPSRQTVRGRRVAPRRPPVWHGEEVFSPSRGPAVSAEEAAARAEGNAPMTAADAAHPDPGTYTDRGPARRPRAHDPDAAENAEEKRESAVEEHAALPSRRFPHGKL